MEPARRLDLVKGVLVVAILAGGWYVAATIIGGRAFFDKQVLSENVFTYLNHPGISRGHSHPFYYMELALLAGFMPWSVLLPFAAARYAKLQRLRDPRLLYLIIWLAVVLLFYNFAFSKRGVYLLALYPALSTLVGLCLDQELYDAGSTPWIRILSAGMGIFFVLAAVRADPGAGRQAMARTCARGVRRHRSHGAGICAHLVRGDWRAAAGRAGARRRIVRGRIPAGPHRRGAGNLRSPPQSGSPACQ